ncbi:MAG: MFS transporter [Acidobacteriia bacterium]|nr:MFS transporter [Terriglobia bacterium]
MSTKTYPYTMLAVLTGLNMLNYIDRNVLFGVQPLIQKEFPRSDADYGFLTFAFFIAYMVAAPCVGWLGDRFSRKNIMTVGILIWSGFTLFTWITHTFGQLLFRHTIVGIGEASYATIAPTLIADSFPVERRGRMLAVFFLGLPFGSALGLMLGGIAGHHWGWRMPFMVAGLPGFALALVLWFLPEPPRGLSEAEDSSPSRSTVAGLARNGAFITATLGMAMYTFAVGGLQQWIPTFLVRLRHVPVDKAGIIFGGMAGFNGIVATLLGGWIGDRLLKRYFGAYYTFSGIAMFVAVPLMVATVYVTGSLMFAAMFLAIFFLLLGTAPTNAALVNSVAPRIRSTALAVNIFVIHLLGDATSPYLIGVISGRTSLQTGFWVAFAAAALSGIVLIYGAQFAPRPKAA